MTLALKVAGIVAALVVCGGLFVAFNNWCSRKLQGW